MGALWETEKLIRCEMCSYLYCHHGKKVVILFEKPMNFGGKVVKDREGNEG